MTEFFQALHQAGPPPPVTPAATPSSPSDFAGVTPHGRGPAPYDIQAPQEDLTAVTDAATRLTATGVVLPGYGQSQRQHDTEMLLNSPPGYQEFDIYGGFSGQGTTVHGWPNDVGPPDGD